MRENSKLIIALTVFLMISIIILPTIISQGGFSNVSKNNPSNEVLQGDEGISEDLYKFSTDHLNMRTGPGTEFEIIFTIPIGHKVKVIEHDNGWDKVIYKDKTGYSSSKYLSEFLGDGDESEEDIEVLDSQNENQSGVEVTEYMKKVKGILLVNKDYGLPRSYYPGVDSEAKQQIDELIKMAKTELKKELIVFSGFRSYNYQKKLYESYIETEGAEFVSLYNAEPGHSEHQTGLAFDIGGEMKYWMDEAFGETQEGIWLRENAHKYGFILRYPEDKISITGYGYEPWHFRYVGIDHAAYIFKNELTLEEYLLEVE